MELYIDVFNIPHGVVPLFALLRLYACARDKVNSFKANCTSHNEKANRKADQFLYTKGASICKRAGVAKEVKGKSNSRMLSFHS